MLVRYHNGERHVWSVVRVPTAAEEDARLVHLELGRLGQERIADINRIRALLVLNNLRVKYVGGRLWQRWWTGHAQQLAPRVRAEIERESERLLLVKKQMDTIEAEQRQALAAGTETASRWAGAATRDRGGQRLGVGEGAVWLRVLSQSARGGGLSG